MAHIGQKSKYWSKSNFLANIEILIKTQDIGQKTNFFVKINEFFVKKYEIYSKIEIFVKKNEMLVKVEHLVKNPNVSQSGTFGKNRNFVKKKQIRNFCNFEYTDN